MKDRLIDLFDKQYMFQISMGVEMYDQAYREKMILAIIDECMEILHTTPWKPWKKQQEFDLNQMQNEIIDLWHFVINLSLAAQLNPKELYKLYLKKLIINKKRQRSGY